MKQVLESLMTLQDVDYELQKLEGLKGDLPQQISLLNRELAEAHQHLASEKEKVQFYQKEKTKTELEIKALQGKQQKYQAQLFVRLAQLSLRLFAAGNVADRLDGPPKPATGISQL